jgi:hypothetical protein
MASTIEGCIPSVGSSSKTHLRDGQDLLLAAAERPALPAEQRLECREFGHDLVEARRVTARHAQILGDGEEREDLPSLRHIAESQPRAPMRRLAADIAPFQAQAAADERQIAHQRLQQRRLAHAVVADDADRLAGGNGQAHAVERRNTPVAGADVLRLEHGRLKHGRPCACRDTPRARADRAAPRRSAPP